MPREWREKTTPAWVNYVMWISAQSILCLKLWHIYTRPSKLVMV